MKEVELHCAYQWDCDNCGSEQFVRAVVVEMTADDVKYMLGEYGGEEEDWTAGNWMTRPDEVICSQCGTKFKTTDWDGPSKESL